MMFTRSATRRATTQDSGRDTEYRNRNEHAIALFQSARDAGEPQRRRIHQQIVLEYLGLAEAVAHRYDSRRQDWSDVRQVAFVGLVKAVQRFDASRGDDFVAFAVPTIAGEIKRHLRDNGWVVRPPRQMQELHSTLLNEVPRLTQRLGREPSPFELAADLDANPREVLEALHCHQSMRPVSLDASALGDDSATLADTLGTLDSDLERAELTQTLLAACSTLSERDQRILYLRFIREQTQSEIASDLGVSQMQVSRLLTRILTALRACLSAEPQAA
jgi:RNA polymerase sigma-B factor